MNDAPWIADVAALSGLLEHQRNLYRRLRLLGERQRGLVLMDDPAPLLQLLGERQRLVDGLVALASKMAPYRDRWPQLYSRMDETSRKNITALLEEVNASLGSILNSDRQDTATLQARCADAGRQLSLMNAGRSVEAAYGGAADERGAVLTEAHA